MARLISDGLLIGMSGALLWHFSNIWRYGTHLIQEPSIVMLSVETLMLAAAFVFGVARFIGTLRGG